MELFMLEGKKTEKDGILMWDMLQAKQKTNSEMLEQIDEKLDLLLAVRKAETEGEE